MISGEAKETAYLHHSNNYFSFVFYLVACKFVDQCKHSWKKLNEIQFNLG